MSLSAAATSFFRIVLAFDSFSAADSAATWGSRAAWRFANSFFRVQTPMER